MHLQDTSAADVVAFWQSAGPDRWFSKSAAFDADFKARFEPAHVAAAAGQLGAWARTAEGTLALLILLDQLPRNAYRDTARMFATDPQALVLANEAIANGFDAQVAPAMRLFFYLPFMHSEQLADQQRCLQLTQACGEQAQKFARLHLDIIERFGRFPHRNAALGRTTTPEEQKFLDGGGFAG